MPIVATLSGIVTDINPVHSLNTPMPILSMLSGIIIDVNSVQPLNAKSLILVMLSGIIISPEQVEPSIRISFTITSGFCCCFPLNHGVS